VVLQECYNNIVVLQCRCGGHVSISTLDLAKASGVSVVLVVSQRCHSGVTVVLQWCLSGVIVVLQYRCDGHVSVSTLDLAKASNVEVVLVVLPWCYSGVPVVL
jgi:cobyrinic acid a,c-diamide synthase